MADIDLQVTGLAELEARLIDLGQKGGQRSLRKGLRQGANVVLAEARRRVRKKTGATAKATKVKDQGIRFEEMTFSITTNYVGRFLEFGTSKMPAYPFLRPAAEAKAREAVEAVRDVTLAAIDVEVSKR